MKRVVAISILVALLVALIGCDEMVPEPPEMVSEPPAPEPEPEPERNCPYNRADSGDSDRFNIDITYEEHFVEWLRDEIECAAAYWETAITADIGPLVADVDDLSIVVGFGDVLPAAARTFTYEERVDKGLPYTARIEFASVSSSASEYLDAHGRYLFGYNVARHEIAHALGFSSSSAFESLTFVFTLTDTFCLPSPCPPVKVFSGSAASKAMLETPLLEGDHWKKGMLGRDGKPITDEIMYLSINSYSRVTALTLGAMEDIGYAVDYAMAGR